ncbi:MAG TPA: J domain-containing protein [Kofleriaceae bacterium]
MSITKRILEQAQSGLSRLTSLVIVDDEPLSHVETAALQAELTARKAAREKSGRVPGDTALAKLATSDPASRTAREKAARERSARVHKERDEREARQKAASDEQFRRMKEQAAKGGPMPSYSSTSSSSSSTGSSRPPRPGSNAAKLAEWYRVLDLEEGADMAKIKSSYRQLMRKYHPDMHAGNPSKQKAATELSMRVTTAYNGLVEHLEKR